MKAVLFGTFYRLKPDNVYSVGKIPENHCCCKLCQNFHLDKIAIREGNFKGIGSTTTDIVLGSLCPVNDADTDILLDYGYYNCIARNCKKCGKKKTFVVIYKEKILKDNPEIKTNNEKMFWKRWESTVGISKGDKEINRLDKFTKETTKLEFLNCFIHDLQQLSLHLFNWRWHDNQFDYIKDTLQLGMLLQVLNFAQNYMNIYQDEPKECHWDHSQTVLHPIINHRHCAVDGKLIVEEHVIVSNDLNHDKHAVKAFEKVSMKELEKSGFKPSHVLQFCDNCSSQYKSKGPFQHIANTDIPTIQSYFGPNHGKGPSDSATGRVKSAIVRARNARLCALKNAQEVFEFLHHKFQQWEQRQIKQSEG